MYRTPSPPPPTLPVHPHSLTFPSPCPTFFLLYHVLPPFAYLFPNNLPSSLSLPTPFAYLLPPYPFLPLPPHPTHLPFFPISHLLPPLSRLSPIRLPFPLQLTFLPLPPHPIRLPPPPPYPTHLPPSSHLPFNLPYLFPDRPPTLPPHFPIAYL